MIHLTSVWIPTRQLHTSLGVVLIQKPLITVDGLTEGKCCDVSAQFSEGGPRWPPEGENYNRLWTICTYKTGTLYIFHLSVSCNRKVRILFMCWKWNWNHAEVSCRNLQELGLKMRFTNLQHCNKIGVEENCDHFKVRELAIKRLFVS